MGRTDRTGGTIAIVGVLAVALALVAGPAAAMQDVSVEITAAVNAYRVAQGRSSLPPFATDSQARSAHDRLVATGVMHTLVEQSAGYYFDLGGSDFAEVESFVEGEGCSPEALLAQWVNSDYHRGLILSPDATHLIMFATCDGARAWATGHVLTFPAAPDAGEGSEEVVVPADGQTGAPEAEPIAPLTAEDSAQAEPPATPGSVPVTESTDPSAEPAANRAPAVTPGGLPPAPDRQSSSPPAVEGSSDLEASTVETIVDAPSVTDRDLATSMESPPDQGDGPVVGPAAIPQATTSDRGPAASSVGVATILTAVAGLAAFLLLPTVLRRRE